MRHLSQTLRIVCIAGLLAGLGGTAAAAGGPPTAADMARVEAELARVQQDLREQRQLIFQLMQMHDALMKYLQMSGAGAGAAANAMPALPLPVPAGRGSEGTNQAAPVAPTAGGNRGTISGKVHANGALGEVYVYVDGPKSLASKSATLEIKQQARQFSPTVAVVQVGTRVFFPNEDKVFHNVFSRTPGDAFDLGTLKSGDRPSPVVLLKPGHVEVFCNIHSKMRADVLVVPNSYWTRVRPDGSFQLAGVPVGSHRLVLWGPSTVPATQRVDLTAAGATATFSADGAARRPHMNKQGGAYESYEE